MNLLKKANIIKDSINSEEKIGQKSIKFDVFLFTALFLIVITPFAIILANKIQADLRRVHLFVSPRFEEIFGKETAENLLLEFNEANPDIRVRIFVKQEERANSSRTSGSREPDIFIYDENDNFNEAELLASLNPYLEEIDNDEFPPAMFLAAPLVAFMDVLFYNISALEAAGFDRPPRSLGEYQTYSKTAADYGFFSDDVFSIIENMPRDSEAISRKIEDFAQGRAAMIIASTRFIPHLREKLGDEKFGITAVPFTQDGTRGRYNINLTGIYAGLNINAERPDEARSFIAFLLDRRPEFCEMFKAVPGTVSDLIPGDYVLNDPFYSKAWDIFEYNQLMMEE